MVVGVVVGVIEGADNFCEMIGAMIGAINLVLNSPDSLKNIHQNPPGKVRLGG